MESNPINLVLTNQEVETLLAGLNELPAKFSFRLIINIHNQVQAQLNPPIDDTTEKIEN